MSIIHITNVADLKAGDKATFAPFNVPLFKSGPYEVAEKDGLVGFIYGPEDTFFPVITPEGNSIDNLNLVDATRDEYMLENPENVGKEIFSAADLPAEYGVPVIVRHKKYGDYRGFASNDNIDGREWIQMINGVGQGSFGFWRSGGHTIHLAVGLDFEYNL